MLASCLAKGWSLENYLALEHPLQQWNLQLISEFSGVPRDQIGTAIDGCSLPTFFLPISGMSTSLARFVAAARSGDDACARILSAVAAWPEMIYERGGFDSDLIRVLGGRCIAKRGAMAVFVVGIDTEQHGPIGITAKLEDGNITPMPVIIMRVLNLLGLLSPEESTQLERYQTLRITNWKGIDVGEMVAEFELAR
jgi:L-asparaginase II